MPNTIGFVHPKTGKPLEKQGKSWCDPQTGEPIANTRAGVSDFVGDSSYTSSFGFQWLKTKAVRTCDRQLMLGHTTEMNLRTGFDEMDLAGKSVLEVGAGLGDDTAYMLALGVGEYHALDLSESIYRAAELIDDPRVNFVRADVNAMPYREHSFDIVLCHRMMMHTPHPAETLACASRMVKPGGLLFVHSYHKSKYFNASAKYKYRWLTTRIPRKLLWALIALPAPIWRWTTVLPQKLFAQRGADFARKWSPWVVQASHTVPDADRKALLQYETQITFDSLTPTYDLPMYANDFEDLIRSLGFEILSIEKRPWFPLWATAVRLQPESQVPQADKEHTEACV
ncbi:MAG: class I SAM-dependent methyltransferase [Phycisphaerales bacterium]|nr:class I SAM-dependent methyltransferase [Phycisphaerales bacterium]